MSICGQLQELPDLPPKLQDLRLLGCFNLRSLPDLPQNLEILHLESCDTLRSLPELPATLRELYCASCAELEALPDSLSSTAVTSLVCSRLSKIKSLPQLPSSLVELGAVDCLRRLPALPQGLTCLCVEKCGGLSQVSSTMLDTTESATWACV